MNFTSNFRRKAAISLVAVPFTCAALIDGSRSAVAFAQAPAAASSPAASTATRQVGTVKAIEGNTLSLTTDAGQQVSAAVAANARVLQLAPGSTDLKTAQAATLADVAVGDRVLVSGAPGESASSLNATRVILMKSSDIAQHHETEQADWQRRGTGGIVTAVDAASNSISVSAGARKLQVVASPSTKFRRYADGSVKFEDAKPGDFSQLHPGDQLRVRGTKSADGNTVEAEEIVSGSFKNLSGTVLSIDKAGNSITFRDLATKKNVTVQVTPNSALHKLSPQAATMLAARTKGEPGGGGAAPAQASASQATAGGERAQGGGGGRSGGDLSQVVARQPTQTLSDLKAGDAVMVVAEQSANNNLTAITLLSGVEPILAASPNGSAMTLSPWSVGTGAPEGGGS